MFEYFPKISYNFGGITQTVTNIFKSINLEIDNIETISSTTITSFDKPDKIANDLYNRSDFLWSLFLCNKIKNPLSEWAQTQISYTNRIETEYDGWSYQFANTSNYIPGTTFYFNSDKLDSYLGVDLSGICSGDLIIYETGSGPFSIKCLGAGGITSSEACGNPQFGQSLIPDNFDKQDDVSQLSTGNNFTTCLDSLGRIYVWGDIPNTTNITDNFNKSDRLYTSKNNGYSFVNSSGNNIIAIDNTSGLVCFGGCTAFTANYAGQTGFVKTAWTTSGISGGVAIKSDGTVVNFGLSGPTGTTLTNVACGYNFCVGILGNTRGVTVWGNSNYSIKTIPTTTGITGIAAGYGHALAITDSGEISAWGLNTNNQIPSDTTGYSSISAGLKHSAALTSDGTLKVWGKITTYSANSGCSGTEEIVDPTSLAGTFSKISSGNDHIVLKGSGTNIKYIGIVDNVDNLYKRIFVKSYSFYDNDPVLLEEPSGTIVSVWRIGSNGRYAQIKTIQNQLLTIQKYLDSTLYMEQDGYILDPTGDNWESLYLANHQTPQNNLIFITLRKHLMDVDYVNKLKIYYLSGDKVQILKNRISTLLTYTDHIDIKTSNLL